MPVIWKINPILKKLDDLVGMESLKDTLFCQIIYYVQGLHLQNKDEEFLHTILAGPPGTGKTTVAKIISELYSALGVLRKSTGRFKIAKREDFASYRTNRVKNKDIIESCIGGVLFIDEIYALGPGKDDKDSFAKEAVDTLCSFLSEHPHDLCCIVAGYEKEIDERFLSLNPGLESRFQWRHVIEPYSISDLADIFFKKVWDIKWKTSFDKNDFEKTITDVKLITSSGRDITNLLTKCKLCHSRRVFRMDKVHKFVLTPTDLKNGYIEFKKQKDRMKKDDRKNMMI